MTQRPIKFRAWDKLNNKMVKGAKWEAFARDGQIIIQLTEPEDWIIMQFTGLLDKNGREIFEGDRIKIGNMIWFVFWNKKQARFGFRINRNGKYIYCSPSEITRKGEVYNNVYETPEIV